MQNVSAVASRHRGHVVRWVALVGAVSALVAAFGDVGAQGETPTGCAAKIHEAEQALDAAQRNRASNASVAGLRVALAISRQCDDKALAKARAASVAEKQAKVDALQEGLDRELRDGDANRIRRARQKRDQATQELDAARSEQRR